MKKHLLLLFAALLPLVASAEKVEIDGIWYNLISKAKQAEVTFKGESYSSYDDEYTGSITIPATVTYEGVTYSVKSIGDEAFYKCSRLTAITLPKGVTSIGEDAFRSCSSLTAVTLPESLTSIGDHAFSGCRSLTAVTLPESLTSIGESAFYYCISLTAVHISNIEAWCKIEFGNTLSNPLSYAHNLYLNGELVTNLVIPEGVTSIGYSAFYDCRSLTAITLPEGVTSIGYSAFYDCRSLTAITLPESVTSIGDNTFYNCTSLTAITLPEGVTSIGGFAFSGCSSLTTIMLPKSVKSIGSKTFANCSELTDVYCNAETVPSTKADAFEGSYIEYATLHVPASAVNEYKNTAPWSSFGTIKTIENVTLEKCATPTISYKDGKVVLTCETEGAEVITTVTANNDNTFEALEFDYIPTQTFIAYATKENYENSDPVSLTICWVPCTEEHEKDDADGILTIPAKPVLIQCQGGVITVSGLADGTEVAVYTTSGTLVATATAEGDTTHLTVPTGQVYIVKVADTVVKIGM